jgi:hypothetical protein
MDKDRPTLLAQMHHWWGFHVALIVAVTRRGI